MKRMNGECFFPWRHFSTLYLIVYKKIAYYKQQLLPTPRGWRYFTFGREVKIRKCAILSLGVVGSGILSPEGGTISSPGRTCEGVASERSETRSPKPWDYTEKHRNPGRSERVTGIERPQSLVLTVDFISIPPS